MLLFKIKNRFRAYPTRQAVQTTGSTAALPIKSVTVAHKHLLLSSPRASHKLTPSKRTDSGSIDSSSISKFADRTLKQGFFAGE